MLPLFLLGIVAVSTAAPLSDYPSHSAHTDSLNSLTWSKLHFGTSIMGMPLHAKIKISILSRDKAEQQLIRPNKGHGKSPAKQVLHLDLSSSFVSDKDIHTGLLLNPDDATVLQRTRIELTPGDERYKAYRFTDEGIYILRRKPNPREARQSFEHWSDTKESFVPYPSRVQQKYIVSDTSALLYIASITQFKKAGDKRTFVAYYDDDFHVITIEYQGIKSIRSDFTAQADDGSRQHIMSYRDALLFVINAHPLGKPRRESSLQIAGLEMPIKLYVDREMRIPLEFRGSVGFIDEISLSLEEVALRNSGQAMARETSDQPTARH